MGYSGAAVNVGGPEQELGEVCRHLVIAESTSQRWIAQYGGIGQRGQAGPRARSRERAAQKLVADQGPRHRHAHGDFGGKLLTPEHLSR